MRPFVVVEGPDEAFAVALGELRDSGWTIVDGWAPPAGLGGVVCAGDVSSAESAASALLAAVDGAGLVIAGRAERDVLDRLCDDLRRLGPVDHRLGDARPAQVLTREERALLDHLLTGASLGEGARRLGVSRRTADRRLASARRKLGVATTAAALAELARVRGRHGRPGSDASPS